MRGHSKRVNAHYLFAGTLILKEGRILRQAGRLTMIGRTIIGNAGTLAIAGTLIRNAGRIIEIVGTSAAIAGTFLQFQKRLKRKPYSPLSITNSQPSKSPLSKAIPQFLFISAK